MVQPRERGQTAQGTSNTSTEKAVSPSTGTKGGFSLARFIPSRVDRTATSGAKPATSGTGTPVKKGMGKLLFGMVIFIFGAEAFQYILFFANGAAHLGLEAPVAAHSVPLLGSMSRFTLVYLLFIVLLYIGLYRYNILPRDPFGTKAARAAQASTTTTTVRPVTAAERKRAARRHGASTTGSDAPSARAIAAEANSRPVGEHDDAYERVKAAQRQRQRRKTRR